MCVACCVFFAVAGKAGGVGGSGSITPDSIIPKLRALAKDKNIAGNANLSRYLHPARPDRVITSMCLGRL